MTVLAAFVPAPLNPLSMGGDGHKLLGQPPLRCLVDAANAGGGSATVTVRVTNCVRQRCTGVYDVRVFASATPGGTPSASADGVTNEEGEASVSLSTGTGTWYFHATVRGVYDGTTLKTIT